MRIALLTREPKNYSSTRLQEAAATAGHEIRVFDTLRFSIFVEARGPALAYNGKPVGRVDAVIPRIGSSVTFFGLAVVRQFEQMGTYALNPSQAIADSRDKLRSLQILSRHDIGMPPSAFVRTRSDVLGAIERVGGVPVIVKLLEGTQGIGVILARQLDVASAIVETLQSAKQNVLIQKFVSESKGKDIRALVVGDRVVAAMRRRAQGEEFRSNVHRGGTAELVELTPDYERTAVRAAQIMGLRLAGVDMLEGADGPQVMEVNSSPGLEGIERASGMDIAGEVIGFLDEHAQLPAVDVRQRLTLKGGYSVTEFAISPGSPLVGQTIAETKLRELDIMILSLLRGGEAIPNPRSDRRLQASDHVLCFGSRVSLAEVLRLATAGAAGAAAPPTPA